MHHTREHEKVIFTGGPSQVINFKFFFLSFIFFILAAFAPRIWQNFFYAYSEFKPYYMLVFKIVFFLAVFSAFMAWLRVKCHRYIITTDRLLEKEGIFSKKTEALELFRVKDLTFIEPFLLRIFGLGNIILDTSDKTTPIVVIKAVKDGPLLLDTLRQNVQIMRTKHGVREID